MKILIISITLLFSIPTIAQDTLTKQEKIKTLLHS